MNGMTTSERISDICKLSGLSEDIVRRVLDAEKKSVIKSLKRGERATLIGRVVIRPEMRRRIIVGGKFENYIKLSSSVVSSLEGMLEGITKFEADEDASNNGIRLNQISALN